MSNSSKSVDIKAILLGAAVIFWMGVIFCLSSQPAVSSAEASGTLAEWLLGLSYKICRGNPPDLITGVILKGDHFVRKTGHFIEFFILGLLVVSFFKRMNIKRHIALSITICLLYAVSDEVHQSFVPGRGPLLSDVLLDSASAGIGIFLRVLLKGKPQLQ